MKISSVFIALATAGSLVAAQPHRQRHHHSHVERREAKPAGGPTVIEYELNGKRISKEEVDKGIADGTLVWVDGRPSAKAADAPAPKSPAAPTAPAPVVSPQVKQADAGENNYQPPSSSSAPNEAAYSPPAQQPSPDSSSSAPPPSGSSSSDSSSSSSDSSSSGSSGGTSELGGGEGVDRDFPDGEIDCSTFPSDYGAIPVKWEGLGGWSGVQSVTFNSAKSSIDDISTAIKGGGCTDGSYCSYACPAGYQKSQWPKAQGSTAQSVGGLFCDGGKLKLNSNIPTKKLCTKGAGGVSIENNVDKPVAVCRTDYPGTESETIPLLTKPGGSVELTCPDEATYYKWEGKPTSAQYYVNPPGVPLEKACTWGSGGNVGNSAPVNLGVGKSAGSSWLSIMPNYPTNSEVNLDMKIAIVSSNGGKVSGSCKYENGQFHDDNGTNDKGCTVNLISGEAKYRFS
ncbi:MAG: hypothetical protein M1837_005159 [Sclerophora amabilis]|nr:MAG: hypothetical protein M1837_005159 [Sclerophora amabilis]